MKILTVLLALTGGALSLSCNGCTESTNEILAVPCDTTTIIDCTDTGYCASFSAKFKYDQDGTEDEASLELYACGTTVESDVEGYCQFLENSMKGSFPELREYSCRLDEVCEEDNCNVKKEEVQERGCETEFCNAAQDLRLELALVAAAVVFHGTF